MSATHEIFMAIWVSPLTYWCVLLGRDSVSAVSLETLCSKGSQLSFLYFWSELVHLKKKLKFFFSCYLRKSLNYVTEVSLDIYIQKSASPPGFVTRTTRQPRDWHNFENLWEFWVLKWLAVDRMWRTHDQSYQIPFYMSSNYRFQLFSPQYF